MKNSNDFVKSRTKSIINGSSYQKNLTGRFTQNSFVVPRIRFTVWHRYSLFLFWIQSHFPVVKDNTQLHSVIYEEQTKTTTKLLIQHAQ